MGNTTTGRYHVDQRVNKCSQAHLRMRPDHFKFEAGTRKELSFLAKWNSKTGIGACSLDPWSKLDQSHFFFLCFIPLTLYKSNVPSQLHYSTKCITDSARHAQVYFIFYT